MCRWSRRCGRRWIRCADLPPRVQERLEPRLQVKQARAHVRHRAFADSRAVDAALVACRLHPPPLFSDAPTGLVPHPQRSEEHTSELQSLIRISYAAFSLNKNNHTNTQTHESNLT